MKLRPKLRSQSLVSCLLDWEETMAQLLSQEFWPTRNKFLGKQSKVFKTQISMDHLPNAPLPTLDTNLIKRLTSLLMSISQLRILCQWLTLAILKFLDGTSVQPIFTKPAKDLTYSSQLCSIQ